MFNTSSLINDTFSGIRNSSLWQGAKSLWDDITGRSTEKENTDSVNNTNLQIARENLGFQKELQEYQKALQKQIFEREDTAYQRTAADMAKAGLNPLTMSGTDGAGGVVSMSPLNNTFQAQKSNNPVMTADVMLTAVSGFMNGINQIKTSQLERDSLLLDNDRKYIENNILANSHGIGYFMTRNKHKGLDKRLSEFEMTKDYGDYIESQYYENQNKKREYEHKVDIGRYDSDSAFEKILTAIEDWTINGRSEAYLNKYPFLKKIYNFFTDKGE